MAEDLWSAGLEARALEDRRAIGHLGLAKLGRQALVLGDAALRIAGAPDLAAGDHFIVGFGIDRGHRTKLLQVAATDRALGQLRTREITGSTKPASTAMIPITTSSSVKVKP